MSDRLERCGWKEEEPKTIRDRLMQKTKKELVETIIQLQEENTDLNVQISDLQEEICIARSWVF